jgi:hypothetical protein
VTFPAGDWPRLKDVFAGARALPADARPAYLAEACSGDEVLHQEVESLLASDARAKSFLEAPVVRFDDTTVTGKLEGQRIGPYQLASRIGTGGMGEVYRARDSKLNRQVAIKVLLPAVADDPDRLARFSREAQVLASLNHPHIAQIHGLEDADGVRALVLELVEGPTLADRIAQGAIPSTNRSRSPRRSPRRSEPRTSRDHPSGPEAREHQASRGRHSEGAGLRAGEGPRPRKRRECGSDELAGSWRASDRGWRHHGDSGLHESRAGQGSPGQHFVEHCAERPKVRALVHRPDRVSRRDYVGHDCCNPRARAGLGGAAP